MVNGPRDKGANRGARPSAGNAPGAPKGGDLPRGRASTPAKRSTLILFYSGWHLGYYNLEAERKARALAAAGYEVTYVGGIGIRNPSPRRLSVHAGRIVRILATRRRAGRHGHAAATATEAGPGGGNDARSDGERANPLEDGGANLLGDEGANLRIGSLMVAPPRQSDWMRRLNARWVTRQLRRQAGPWPRTLAWVRWPTPELVEALPRLAPATIVYECVDAYDYTPGIEGRWADIFERYERRLVELAELVVVPGERLAQRFRALGADVRIVPHGVDLIPWQWRPIDPSGPLVVGFVGTLDFRLDVAALRAVAERHPDWRVRLIGPIQLGFDPRALADLPNVSVEPPVPSERVPHLIAGFDLGLMPYADHPHVAHMTPLKCLELLAAGKPTVARRSLALEPFAELLYFADTPDAFVRQLERAAAEDTRELAQARRRAAEQSGWPRRLDEIVAIADELTPPQPPTPPSECTPTSR